MPTGSSPTSSASRTLVGPNGVACSSTSGNRATTAMAAKSTRSREPMSAFSPASARWTRKCARAGRSASLRRGGHGRTGIPIAARSAGHEVERSVTLRLASVVSRPRKSSATSPIGQRSVELVRRSQAWKQQHERGHPLLVCARMAMSCSYSGLGPPRSVSTSDPEAAAVAAAIVIVACASGRLRRGRLGPTRLRSLGTAPPRPRPWHRSTMPARPTPPPRPRRRARRRSPS